MSEAFNLSTAAAFQARARRLAELDKEATAKAGAELPTTYQGQDPLSGTAQFQRLGEGTVLGGEVITTGAIGVGDAVLPRSTSGLTRLDSSPNNGISISCGADGSPRADTLPGLPVVAAVENSGLVTLPNSLPIAGVLTCPTAGTIVPGSAVCLGLAQTYQIYTGTAAGNPPVCTTTLRVIPNAAECKKPGTAFGVDGCSTNIALPTSNCQWISVTQAQAEGATGCPTGTTFTGFAELPSGTFRALCCAPAGETAPVAGDGCNWQLARWKCLNGVCIEDYSESSPYATKSECEAALIPANFTGGQCVCAHYRVNCSWNVIDLGGSPIATTTQLAVWGPVTEISLVMNNSISYGVRITARGGVSAGACGAPGQFTTDYRTGSGATNLRDIVITRLDGIDNCGNLPATCPP